MVNEIPPKIKYSRGQEVPPFEDLITKDMKERKPERITRSGKIWAIIVLIIFIGMLIFKFIIAPRISW